MLTKFLRLSTTSDCFYDGRKIDADLMEMLASFGYDWNAVKILNACLGLIA